METKSAFIITIFLALLVGCTQPINNAPETAQGDIYTLNHTEQQLTYTVQTNAPTPCHTTTHEATVQDSILTITINHAQNQTGEELCIQVIDTRQINGTLNTTMPERIHIQENNEYTIQEQIMWQPQIPTN